MFVLVAAAVLSAAPDAGPAPFSWDVPGQVQLVPVGKQLEGGGLPMAVFLARSTWELDRLLLHYAARFAEAGYFIPPKMGRITGLKLPRVVALDDVRMVSFLVYGWPEADGTTTLVLGAADLKNRKQAQGGRLPVFPGAKSPTTFNVELATAVSFTAKATQEEVIDFYRSVLPSGGWKEREPGTFVKEGRVVRVLAKKQKASTELSVVVLEQSDDGPMPAP
ncbi:MAG: hypothetical protein Q8N23_32760 [Archangium sp.]|nr:hypothetical protein [Archangium sp.]MDP3157486.1 hypothetical protein [Archangium sp.]